MPSVAAVPAGAASSTRGAGAGTAGAARAQAGTVLFADLVGSMELGASMTLNGRARARPLLRGHGRRDRHRRRHRREVRRRRRDGGLRCRGARGPCRAGPALARHAAAAARRSATGSRCASAQHGEVVVGRPREGLVRHRHAVNVCARWSRVLAGEILVGARTVAAAEERSNSVQHGRLRRRASPLG